MASKEQYQGRSEPALPNNFSAKRPATPSCPKIGGGSFGPSPNKSERGKDGTQG